MPTGIKSGAMTIRQPVGVGGGQAPVGVRLLPREQVNEAERLWAAASVDARRWSREYVYEQQAWAALGRPASVAGTLPVSHTAASRAAVCVAERRRHAAPAADTSTGTQSQGSGAAGARQRWSRGAGSGMAALEAAVQQGEAAMQQGEAAMEHDQRDTMNPAPLITARLRVQRRQCGRYPYPACNKVITRCRVARPLNP